VTWKRPLSIGSLYRRAKILATGKLEWEDTETGVVTVEHAKTWHLRWIIAGVHPVRWKWYRRAGRMGCGCTRSPFTHKIKLFLSTCPEHGLSTRHPRKETDNG
jgi:hypothetical protein